ncbi:uncharacterized protein V6R79_013876 [Siganus canaliculatus]
MKEGLSPDVTLALPPSLNLHFLWVLPECMCARAAEQFTKAESCGHTSVPRSDPERRECGLDHFVILNIKQLKSEKSRRGRL